MHVPIDFLFRSEGGVGAGEEVAGEERGEVEEEEVVG